MPEKTIAEIPRNLRELYDKGNAALQKKNFDYAIAIYGQVLAQEPAFYPGREALRACQFAKAEGGGGFFKKMLGTASASPQLAKAQLQLRNNPREALLTCEQILNNDPNSLPAHKILAEAALALDYPKTAVLSLEIVFKSNPRDLEDGMRLGAALGSTGQIQRAQTVYAELQKAHPRDQNLAMAMKNVAAKRTMREGGYEGLESGTGSYRDILRDKKESASLEQEHRHIKSDDVAGGLLADYAARLLNEPENRRLLRSIAELHAQRKEFAAALEYYARITAVEGAADPSLEKAIAETKLKQLDHQITLLDPAAEDYTARRQALEQAKEQFQLAEARRMVEKYPNDLALRFELGQMLYHAGKIGEAIQEFQKAQHNPSKKIASLRYLGQCFAQRNMHDLAARSLQNALAEKNVFDEEKKELLYTLGGVLEKQGKLNDAIEQYKQIYEIDIGYKDVAAKVDAYYASAG